MNISKKKINGKQPEQKFKGFVFLGIVVLLYIILYFVDSQKTTESLQYFFKNTLRVLPIFLLVIVLTALINFYFPKGKIIKILQGKSRFRTYIYSLIAGIVSHGPIFVWYPLLNELRQKGISKGTLVTFFYGRSIKLTLIPIMIGFFGQIYTLIFMVYIAIAALLQGVLYDFVDKDKGIN